jgi:hypothetical protein
MKPMPTASSWSTWPRAIGGSDHRRHGCAEGGGQMSGSLRQRSFRARLAKLEAPVAGPSAAEVEQEAEFLLMLDRRFKCRQRPAVEEAAMQLLREATTFEERKAAVEAYEAACKLRPYLGKDPAEVLSARHKPLRGEEGVP